MVSMGLSINQLRLFYAHEWIGLREKYRKALYVMGKSRKSMVSG